MTLRSIKNRCSAAWHLCHFSWLDVTYILETRTQRDELKRLVRWAKRKKPTRVCKYYQRLLKQTESRLSSQSLRHPHLTAVAEWLYCAASMLNPPSDVYMKGAAAKYRLRK